MHTFLHYWLHLNKNNNLQKHSKSPQNTHNAKHFLKHLLINFIIHTKKDSNFKQQKPPIHTPWPDSPSSMPAPPRPAVQEAGDSTRSCIWPATRPPSPVLAGPAAPTSLLPPSIYQSTALGGERRAKRNQIGGNKRKRCPFFSLLSLFCRFCGFSPLLSSHPRDSSERESERERERRQVREMMASFWLEGRGSRS